MTADPAHVGNPASVTCPLPDILRRLGTQALGTRPVVLLSKQPNLTLPDTYLSPTITVLAGSSLVLQVTNDILVGCSNR